MIPEAVIWADPGGMTGFAALIEHGSLFLCGEYGFEDACRYIEGACAHYGGRLSAGWERYTINPRLPQQDAHLAMEMIGVIRWCARKHGCVILEPAQQHTPKGDDRRELEAIGWWRPGKNDAQSAAWHMLSWLRKTRQLPPRERAILSELSVH